MSTGARDFANKLIRMRTYLVQNGKSYRNEMAVYKAIKRLKSWLDFYPAASDEQVARYLQKNADAVMALMPGTRSAAHQSLQQQFNNLIYGDND